MGVGLLEIGVEMRRILMFSVKRCYITVLNHPFLVGMLCFIAFLYRTFPFLFSILLAASPVLVCTAVLLGTLLSFGQPNIPEIEREEKTITHDIVPLKTGVLYDTTHFVSEDSYYVERYTERDLVEQSIDKISDLSPLLEERSRDFQFEDGVFEQNNEENEEKHGDEELMEIQYSSIPAVDEGFEEAARGFYEQNNEKNEEKHDNGDLMESQYSPIPTVDSESVESDFDRSDSFDSKMVNLNSLPGSPWKKETEEEEKEEEQEEEEDDDDDESFDSGSDRAESSSPDASLADIMPMLHELHPLLGEDTPQHVSLLHNVSDAASDSSGKTTESDNESDDGCENQEEVEVADDENEDGEKRDEEDKSKSAITWTEEDQKNLIDLGSSEVERNQRLENLMARRRALKKMRTMMTEKNLIDLESADLPFNIPSISTARNNPFDAPNDNYDLGLPPIPGSAPSVLVPRRNPFDLPYDSSEEKPDLMEDEEFITFQAKDPLFRRHESFIVRPSIFGLNRQDKQDVHWRPYFVPEKMASEGTSYSPFQRQSSELSDSKVSSVPETESLSSVEDLEDKELIDERISEEPKLISKQEHISEHVRHGSQSSEEVEFLVQLGTLENHHEAEKALLQEGRELNPTDIQSKPETSYQRYSSQSSSSSLAEVSERVFVDKEGEMRSSFEEIMGHVEQNGISREASFDGPNFHVTSTSVDHTSRGQPIYDSSPSAIRENIFSSSFSSDQHVESETGFSPIRTVSFIERESQENSQDIEKSLPTNEEILAPEDELDVAKAETSQNDEILSSANAFPVPEFVLGQASADSKLSENEDIVYEEGIIEHEQLRITCPGLDTDTCILSNHAEYQTVESLSTFDDLSSSNVVENLATDDHTEVDEELVSGGHASVEKSISQHEEELAHTDKSIDEQPSENREVTEPPAILVESIEEASTTENVNVSEIHDLDNGIPIISSPRTPDCNSNLHEVVGPAGAAGLKSIFLDEAENDNQIKVLENYVLPAEIADFHHDEQYIVEETDGIEDIDEVLFLSELDTVGDFSINEGLSAFHAVDSATTEFSEEAHAEVHERKFPLHPEILNASAVEENDKHEEKECASEIQNSGMSIIDHIDASHTELSEAEVDNAVDPRSIEGGLPEDNLDTQEVVPKMPIAEAHNSFFEIENSKSTQTEVTEVPQEVTVKEEADSGMSVLEAQTIQDIESAFWQVFEKEMEKSNVLEQSNAKDPGMPVLEAQTVEDIESAFRSTSEKEIEHSNVLELPNAELVTEQSESSNNSAAVEVSSSVPKDSGMPELEAQTVEDIELAFQNISEKEIENSNVLEQSGSSDNAAAFEVSNSVQEDSGMPVVEAQTIEDIESAFKITSEEEIVHSDVLELRNVNLVTEDSGSSANATVFEVSSSAPEDSGMPVVEAQTTEDIESVFESTSEKEIVHSNVLELPNAKLVTEESGHSDDAAVFDVSSKVPEDSGMPVQEAQTVDDIELAFKNISEKEIENSNVLELPDAKLVTEGSGSSDDAAVFEVSSSVVEDSGMPALEAQTVEDINLAFRQISENEVEKSNVLELHNAKLVTKESGDSDNAAVFDVSSSVQEDSGMPVVEAQTVEDIESPFTITSEKEMAHSDVPVQPNAKLVTEEPGSSDAAAVFEASSSVLEDSRMPVVEAQTIEDNESAFRITSEREIVHSDVLEQPNARLETEESRDADNAAVIDVSSSVLEDSGMPVLEAQTVEDIESAFRQISEQEIAEKSNVLEQPNAELATEESGNIAAAAEASSSALEGSEMPALEAQTVEEMDMVFRRISEKEAEESNVLEQPNAELATEVSGSSDNAAVVKVSSVTWDMQLPILETRPTEYFDLDHEKLSESDDETLTHHDSVGDDEHMREPKDIGASSDSQNVETDLPLKQILEEQPRGASSSNDIKSSVRGYDVSEFGEGETGKGDDEVVVKEAKALIAEKPEHAVDMPTTADA
ncbi:uncharacterized protein LOC132607305 [Lycium barbarum]|uniref:uncharacterized protein LOC132607305 n=1 Tax=Lycium barbarum TaxID=112863 RepID=UPI00293E38D9|nr:uncharacterized protein LOC132607305 [Lycium barbarum]